MESQIIFGKSINFLLIGGSISKTSSAAPAIFFVTKAEYNAFSSTISPLDELIKKLSVSYLKK